MGLVRSNYPVGEERGKIPTSVTLGGNYFRDNFANFLSYVCISHKRPRLRWVSYWWLLPNGKQRDTNSAYCHCVGQVTWLKAANPRMCKLEANTQKFLRL